MTTTWLTAAVTAADDAVRNAAHQGGAELAPMGVAELAELGGSLDHLLAQLATWTRRVAPQVADLPAHHELREDTGTVDPAPAAIRRRITSPRSALTSPRPRPLRSLSTPPSPTSPSTTTRTDHSHQRGQMRAGPVPQVGALGR